MDRVAHNISIPSLIGILSDLMVEGNTVVDIMIDDELTIRLRGSIPGEKKKKNEDNLPDWVNLTDLT